jgi:urease accessory protein
MTAEALQRLHLLQLVSPALPVGAFSYSEGLEVLVQRGRLANAAAVEAWLLAELERGALTLEAASLPGLMLLAQREAPEMRAQQRQMGGSLLTLLADLGWPLPAGPPTRVRPLLAWPAAWAWALLALAIPEQTGLEAYLYGWVATQLSAAVRLVPLGPTEAQRIQLRLAPRIAERAEALFGSGPEDLWSGGVGAGLAQLGHGELYSRLFRS